MKNNLIELTTTLREGRLSWLKRKAHFSPKVTGVVLQFKKTKKQAA